MIFSDFGRRYAADTDSGILQLMQDITAASRQPGVKMLGGGNPALIPEVMHRFQQRFLQHAATPAFIDTIGRYSGPGGDAGFIQALAVYFQGLGWPVEAEHIALPNGTQNAFFCLFNLFAGQCKGQTQRILLPLSPEYIGYDGSPIDDSAFVSRRPQITLLPEQQFKYHLDPAALALEEQRIGAICVSRPTNPTGNVLGDDEIDILQQQAKAHGIPLIVDNAYGAPFPNIIDNDVSTCWQPGMVMCLSLSKLGLPALRTGIVVADPEIIAAITAMNAAFNLAPTAIGPATLTPMLQDQSLTQLCQAYIRPFYRDRTATAIAYLHQIAGGLPWRVHKPEGAIFIWLWLEGLPISTLALYQRLKAQGLVIVPGEYFFPGLEHDPWEHKSQCIRVSIAQNDAVLLPGLDILGAELRRLYQA